MNIIFNEIDKLIENRISLINKELANFNSQMQVVDNLFKIMAKNKENSNDSLDINDVINYFNAREECAKTIDKINKLIPKDQDFMKIVDKIPKS
jgi:hypothetical protein